MPFIDPGAPNTKTHAMINGRAKPTPAPGSKRASESNPGSAAATEGFFGSYEIVTDAPTG
jgi:hypothetical protein